MRGIGRRRDRHERFCTRTADYTRIICDFLRNVDQTVHGTVVVESRERGFERWALRMTMPSCFGRLIRPGRLRPAPSFRSLTARSACRTARSTGCTFGDVFNTLAVSPGICTTLGIYAVCHTAALGHMQCGAMSDRKLVVASLNLNPNGLVRRV